MSRIFDAVKKNNIIDFGEIRQVDVDSEPAYSEHTIEEPRRATHAALPPPKIDRAIRLNAPRRYPILPFDGQYHAAAEQYRVIRTKILHSSVRPQVILVSSASSGDGKTVSSINIAASLAMKEESNVLLVEGDLCHPSFATALGLPEASGLCEVLSGELGLDSVLIRTSQFPNLFILRAGHPARNATELLDSKRWHLLIEGCRTRFTNVVIDAPPIATVADYELLQLACDGVVVVARPGHSDRAALFAALETVPRDKLLGVVLNCVEDWWFWKTPAYGYYAADRLGKG